MDEQAQQVVTKALQLMTPHLDDQKYTTMYVTPSEKYSDSFVRTHRKGSGFLGMGKPDMSMPVDNLEVSITFKPGVIRDDWVGYVISFDAATQKINGMSEWTLHDVEKTPPFEVFTRLAPHVLALLDQPLTSVEPPREAPAGLY